MTDPDQRWADNWDTLTKLGDITENWKVSNNIETGGMIELRIGTPQGVLVLKGKEMDVSWEANNGSD